MYIKFDVSLDGALCPLEIYADGLRFEVFGDSYVVEFSSRGRRVANLPITKHVKQIVRLSYDSENDNLQRHIVYDKKFPLPCIPEN